MLIIHEMFALHILSLIIYDEILIKLNKRLNNHQMFIYYYYIPVRSTDILFWNLQMDNTKQETFQITFIKGGVSSICITKCGMVHLTSDEIQ